jgi:hypothetical protein
MSSRRKFLFKSSMAATALLASKPFTSFANTVSPVSGFSINDNQVVLVHAGYYHSTDQHQAIQHIAELKSNTGNLLLLNAGPDLEGYAGVFNYDASAGNINNELFSSGNYKIIYKGNIKTGVITAAQNEAGIINNINELSTFLKKEKNCHLVVCLSQLGFKNKDGMDDIALALASTDLDIIVGGHATNFCQQPFVTLNKNMAEVIIHHAAGNTLALGKMAIEFDNRGRKKNVAFNNRKDAKRI